MATMDIIKLYGEAPANFLDVGGGASKEKVTAASRSSPPIPSAGHSHQYFWRHHALRCDREGVIAAVKEVGLKVPLVVRLEGTNVELGKKIIGQSGLNVSPPMISIDAAQKIVKAVRSARSGEAA